MAITEVLEVASDRALSGQWRAPYKYTRSFLVRVDDPQQSIMSIALSPGIRYLDPHPDDGTCLMQDFATSVADDAGIYYRVTFQYFPLPPYEGGDDGGGGGGGGLQMPADSWSASGSITSGPCTVDRLGRPIVNSAGDPISDLEMDHAEFRLQLTRCFANMSWTGAAIAYTNAVNSGSWGGSPDRTWKCHFQNAAKRQESSDAGSLVYWETTWEFVFRASTWDLMPLNVGLQERANGKKRVIQINGETAVTPVALTRAGLAAPNADPEVINAGNGSRVYRELDFSVFGVPS